MWLRYEQTLFPKRGGYSFGPHWYKANGQWYLGTSPSKKSVQRLKTTVGNLLVPGNNAPWHEVRDTLNRSLRGWSNYFCYGTRRSAFRSVDREELGFPEPSMKVYGLAVARPVLVRSWKRKIELIEHPGRQMM